MYFKRLKDLRIDGDYLQKDIANILDISQQYYSKYELGSFTIPTEHLIDQPSHVIIVVKRGILLHQNFGDFTNMP